MVNVNTDWITKPTGITKCVTLVVNIVCIALLSKYGVAGKNMEASLVITTATGGFLLVDIVLLLGYVLEGSHGKAAMQELITAGGAAVMMVAAGGLTIDVVKDGRGEVADALKSYGALCIINAIVYIVHGFFCYKNK